MNRSVSSPYQSCAFDAEPEFILQAATVSLPFLIIAIVDYITPFLIIAVVDNITAILIIAVVDYITAILIISIADYITAIRSSPCFRIITENGLLPASVGGYGVTSYGRDVSNITGGRCQNSRVAGENIYCSYVHLRLQQQICGCSSKHAICSENVSFAASRMTVF